MENLESLEKAINSELTTKILSSKIKHDQINICIEDNNLIGVSDFRSDDFLSIGVNKDE